MYATYLPLSFVLTSLTQEIVPDCPVASEVSLTDVGTIGPYNLQKKVAKANNVRIYRTLETNSIQLVL